MYIVQALVFAILLAISTFALVILWRILRGVAKRRLLAQARYLLCDAPEGVGISVLYCGSGSADAVERLLDVGYGRYEVVLVVDAMEVREAFVLLVERYNLVQVNHTLSGELPAVGVRGLYRSRKRCFRRLVVVDKRFTTVDDGLNAAVGVASYDYVLPMREGWALMPNAVERMAAELSECALGTSALVWSWMGVPAMLLSREMVVDAGGFAHKPWCKVPHSRRCLIYEPLLCSEPGLSGVARVWRLLWAMVLAVGVVGAAVNEMWMVCALLLTVAVVWSAMRAVVPFVSQGTGRVFDVTAILNFLFRRFNVKNFTIP